MSPDVIHNGFNPATPNRLQAFHVTAIGWLSIAQSRRHRIGSTTTQGAPPPRRRRCRSDYGDVTHGPLSGERPGEKKVSRRFDETQILYTIMATKMAPFGICRALQMTGDGEGGGWQRDHVTRTTANAVWLPLGQNVTS